MNVLGLSVGSAKARQVLVRSGALVRLQQVGGSCVYQPLLVCVCVGGGRFLVSNTV